jgi:hypothetical protein
VPTEKDFDEMAATIPYDSGKESEEFSALGKSMSQFAGGSPQFRETRSHLFRTHTFHDMASTSELDFYGSKIAP